MRIYIAGPYGDHNPEEIIAKNVAVADKLARDLLYIGHEVYCPHKMSWHWEKDSRLTLKDFMRLDFTFLKRWAEAIIRISGYSVGADAEVKLARKLGLIVFHNIDEIHKKEMLL